MQLLIGYVDNCKTVLPTLRGLKKEGGGKTKKKSLPLSSLQIAHCTRLFKHITIRFSGERSDPLEPMVRKFVGKMTHNDLVKIAEKWLIGSRKCGAVLTELVTLGMETPDAIGFRDGTSTLVECKTSRSDFLADAKKLFRRNPWMGMGTFRFYLCPAGIITAQDLPEKWGLIWVDEKGRARLQIGPKGNIWSTQEAFRFDEKNTQAEQAILVSALRRAQGR